MGIQGLLPQLKSIMAPIHVEELRGQSVAVDAYSWLHKGAFSCATQLCKGISTSRHIDYCMHRVNLFRHYDVKPVLVFDGGILPMKVEQETKRSRARKENLARAMEHEATGNSAAAFACYQKAVDISPSIALELIQVLKQEKIDYIVAPYEADAQMAFLSINNLVDVVITEDSDLIPFGCSRIIFKMDKFGQGVEYQSSKLGKNKELHLTGFTKQMLLEMCIFSGCDYLPSLPGMGVKRAHALIMKLKNYENVIKHLRYTGVSVPPLFEEMFRKAIWAFQHQRVYDPAKEDIVHLSDVPHGVFEDLEFLGPSLPQGVAKGIAQGDVDPITKIPFQGNGACNPLMVNTGCQAKRSLPSGGKKRIDLPVQKNLLTNYFCLASLEARRKFKAPKIVPRDVVAKYPSSPSSENFDSESPASAEETTCIENDTRGTSVGSTNADDDGLRPKDCIEDTKAASMEDKTANCRQKVDRLSLKSEFKELQYSSSPDIKHEERRPFLASHNEYGSKTKMDDADISTKSMNREVIVRSSYFAHKSSSYNEDEHQGDGIIEEKENDNSISGDCPVPKTALCGNAYIKSALRKRKSFEDDDNKMMKNARIAPVHSDHDSDASDLQNKGTGMQTEGKFGCDISHLNRYSGIAEKSMERFASLISSLGYNPSGSRASGLRAPLKELKNACSTRPKIPPIEIEKFAYIPKK